MESLRNYWVCYFYYFREKNHETSFRILYGNNTSKIGTMNSSN